LRVSLFKKFPYHQDYRDVVYEDTRGYGTWSRLFQINDGAELYRPIPPPEGIGLHNGILLIRLLCFDNVQVVKRARSSVVGDAESIITPRESSSLDPKLLHTPRMFTPRGVNAMPTHHESRHSEVSGEEANEAA